MRLSLVLLIALTATLAVACGGSTKRTTGVDDLDGVINTVESRDATAIRALLQFSSIPCTTELGDGGPPKCVSGEPDGAPVEVFEFYGCAVDWRRQSAVDVTALEVADAHPERYAAFELTADSKPHIREPSSESGGQYIVVFDARYELLRGLAIAVGDGKITALWFPCGEGVGAFIPPGQTDFLLKPPS